MTVIEVIQAVPNPYPDMSRIDKEAAFEHDLLRKGFEVARSDILAAIQEFLNAN